jgi:hypothetical protein
MPLNPLLAILVPLATAHLLAVILALVWLRD